MWMTFEVWIGWIERNTIRVRKLCHWKKGDENHHSKKNVNESFFFLLIASICVSRGCLPSFLNCSSLALKHVGHSNVTAHICTHKAHTRTHASTSTIYVCEDEMRRKEKGCSCCLDSKIEVATQQWSLKSFVFKIYRVTHKTVGETGSGRRDSTPCTASTFCLLSLKSSFFLFLPCCCCCCNVIQIRSRCSNQLYELLTVWRHKNVIQFKTLIKRRETRISVIFHHRGSFCGITF